MLVKTLVLGGENRIAHRFGHGADLDHRASFFAELTDESTLDAIDAQRHLRPVIGQLFQSGQCGVDDYCRKNKD